MAANLHYDKLPQHVRDNISADQWGRIQHRVIQAGEPVPDTTGYINLLNGQILQHERGAKILAHTPMNRFGEASELMGPVVFLCSRKAGSFVTGCHLTVDGGFSSMEFN